jgi:large subunit ribosomal protein L5
MKYDPEIGIFGLDVSAALGRRGKRVQIRRILRAKVPKYQRLTKKEGIEFVKSKFGVEVVD